LRRFELLTLQNSTFLSIHIIKLTIQWSLPVSKKRKNQSIQSKSNSTQFQLNQINNRFAGAINSQNFQRRIKLNKTTLKAIEKENLLPSTNWCHLFARHNVKIFFPDFYFQRAINWKFGKINIKTDGNCLFAFFFLFACFYWGDLRNGYLFCNY
jgi:DNA-binding XRE family transcriptional regulator